MINVLAADIWDCSWRCIVVCLLTCRSSCSIMVEADPGTEPAALKPTAY